ncbi:hypothetical protein M5689_013348 [Euphorbia peplus]|nr:hypothetical protein M5689_013348 [Euphorbia peplus]
MPSLEALAMAGVDYRGKHGIALAEKEKRDKKTPQYLLADEYSRKIEQQKKVKVNVPKPKVSNTNKVMVDHKTKLEDRNMAGAEAGQTLFNGTKL